MAESSSSALPGDVEWLPGLGGKRLLRIHPPSPEPPTLILRTAAGAELRLEASPGPLTEYELPGELDWEAAWLVWPDGARAAVPAPHGRAAEVIELRPHRFRPSSEQSPSANDVATAVEADPPPPRGFVCVPASVPRSDKPAGPAWTTPPQLGAAPAQREWRDRHEDVEHELAEASAAIGRAREGERLAREAVLSALTAARADLRAVRAAREADASAFAALSGELEAERNAHAVTRGSIGTLADALAAARAEAVSLRSALEAERAARESAETQLREINERAGLLERVAELGREAARDEVEFERRAREQAEAAAAAARRPPEEAKRLLADLDSAAAALRAAAAARIATATPDVGIQGGDEPDLGTPAREEPDVGNPAGDEPDLGTPLGNWLTESTDSLTQSTGLLKERATSGETARVGETAFPGDRCLRKALVALAHEDAGAAGALLVGLLPAQGAVIEGSLSYDLTVRGIGTFAVFVEDGSARVVRLSGRRPRNQALFHLAGDPSTLAELLAGDRTKLARLRRRGRVTGRRNRARELAALPESRLSLADAVRAGARLEPALVYRALPFAIEPEWTKGHRFTVAQQILELAPHAWHVSARDGLPLRVVEHAAEAPADATVTMSRAAFERLLKDEPHPLGDRPVIRGDREAVAVLKRWTDLARGA